MKTKSTDTVSQNNCSSHTWHFRMYTFGSFHIDWVDPNTGQVFPLPPERLQGQNAGSALSLLKALLGCPDRFATRSWLLEQFWPTSRQHSANERLSDVVSSLRGLLRPPGSKAMLVHYVYGPNGQGAGFRLDGYPQIWCDAHAFEWYVRHGMLLDQRGQDSTACWEHASQLMERGIYLPEYLYDDWASKPRESLNGLGRDCVQRWTCLLRQAGHVDEAIMRLRTYWLKHQTDEDVLRPLLEMLGERERFQEAEECYAKAQVVVKEDGYKLHERTQDALEAVRALKIQRLPELKNPVAVCQEKEQEGSCSPIHPEHIMPETLGFLRGQNMDTLRRLLVQYAMGMTASALLPLPSSDLLERFSQVLSTSSHVDKTMIDELEMQTNSYWQKRLSASFTSANLLKSAHTHFAILTQFLQGALLPSERMQLCAVGSETAQVIGMLLFDLGAYTQARHYFQVAIRAAQEAHDPLREMIAWGNLSFAWTYDNHPQAALPCIQKAQTPMKDRMPLTIQAEMSCREAEIASLLGNRDACFQALHDAEHTMEAMSLESPFWGIQCDQSRYFGYQGACFRRLYDQDTEANHLLVQEGKEALQAALLHCSPFQARRQSTLELDLAEMLLRQREYERAFQHALQATLITQRTGSHMMYRRLWGFRKSAGENGNTFVQPFDQQLMLLSTMLQRNDEVLL